MTCTVCTRWHCFYCHCGGHKDLNKCNYCLKPYSTTNEVWATDTSRKSDKAEHYGKYNYYGPPLNHPCCDEGSCCSNAPPANPAAQDDGGLAAVLAASLAESGTQAPHAQPNGSNQHSNAPSGPEAGKPKGTEPAAGTGLIGKYKKKWDDLDPSKKKLVMVPFFLVLLILGWLASHLGSGKSGLDAIKSGEFDWTSPKALSGVVVLLIVCYFAKGMCGPPSKEHVWSTTQKAYVPRQGPVSLTTTEGGIGMGGYLLILLIVGGICCYFVMEQQQAPRGPIIPMYGPGMRPPPRQFPPPRRY